MHETKTYDVVQLNLFLLLVRYAAHARVEVQVLARSQRVVECVKLRTVANLLLHRVEIL